MIKVQFKNAFENFYAGKHYTYKAYDKNQVVFTGAYEISGFEESEANGVKVFTKQLDTSADNW